MIQIEFILPLTSLSCQYDTIWYYITQYDPGLICKKTCWNRRDAPVLKKDIHHLACRIFEKWWNFKFVCLSVWSNLPVRSACMACLSNLPVWSACMACLFGCSVWSSMPAWPVCLVCLSGVICMSGLSVWFVCLFLYVWCACMVSLVSLYVWSVCLVCLFGLCVCSCMYGLSVWCVLWFFFDFFILSPTAQESRFALQPSIQPHVLPVFKALDLSFLLLHGRP